MKKKKYKAQFILRLTEDGGFEGKIEGVMHDMIHMIEAAMMDNEQIIDLFFLSLIHMVGDIEDIKKRTESIKNRESQGGFKSSLASKGKVVN